MARTARQITIRVIGVRRMQVSMQMMVMICFIRRRCICAAGCHRRTRGGVAPFTRLGRIQARLDQILALRLGYQRLQLGRGKSVYMAGFRGHQQQDLGAR